MKRRAQWEQASIKSMSGDRRRPRCRSWPRLETLARKFVALTSSHGCLQRVFLALACGHWQPATHGCSAPSWPWLVATGSQAHLFAGAAGRLPGPGWWQTATPVYNAFTWPWLVAAWPALGESGSACSVGSSLHVQRGRESGTPLPPAPRPWRPTVAPTLQRRRPTHCPATPPTAQPKPAIPPDPRQAPPSPPSAPPT